MALDTTCLPRHIAIIMDGNGRWAEKQNKSRSFGHKAGAEQSKEIVNAIANLGIEYVTLYIFSTENWKRTEDEVGYLMNLIKTHLRSEFDFYKKNKIRLLHIGDRKTLPRDIQTEINIAISDTKDFTGTSLVMAINYGGRDEIIRGVNKIIKSNKEIKTLTEKDISESLDIPTLPDVDLLIRTGGEKRLSNFLLWHASYAELIFTDTLWPDYTVNELYKNIEEFQSRSRRFGDVNK